MIVYYRLSARESRHEDERPVYAHDKYRLVKFCLKSFVGAWGELRPRIVFLMDKCPADWSEMVREVIPAGWETEFVEVGKHGQDQSYLVQLEMAKKQGEEKTVFFQEDDYYYLPSEDTGEKIEAAIWELGFVNPYDHGEFYKMPDYHPTGPYEIKVVDDQHWRTVMFNTMTWGTRVELLKEYWQELTKHGCYDKDTWDGLREKGMRLWSPIPTLATHMHSEWLSPGIEWEEHWNVD